MANSFVEHKQRGNDLYRSQKYHDAIREYTKCIFINNGSYLAFANRAMCYLNIGKYEKAEIDCTKCLQIAPKYVKGYLRRGAARKALGKFELSLSDYCKVLKLQPKNSQANQEINGLKQIIQTKKSFKNANNIQNKKKRQTKINKIHQNIEHQVFKKLFDDNDNNENDNNQSKDKFKDKNKIFYGQFVVGPPGSGKTTYCHTISQYMTNVLHRNVAIINLDPNNENIPYHPLINIFELISSNDVEQHLNLGPNGSLIYCLEYLSENMQWLRMKLNNLCSSNTYLIFDCPGQIELYIHHKFMRNITNIMMNKWHFRISCVNLIDCYHCCSSNLQINDNSNFISIALMTTSMMLHLELPHINVLSKCDLIKYYDKNIPMSMDFYTEGHDFQKLLPTTNHDDNLSEMEKKFKRLNQEFAACINDYGLVSFVKFSINDLNSMKNVCKLVDRSNGYDLMGEYYKQIEMEQKIINQRVHEQQHQQQDVNQNEDVFSLNNPLLQNTPFSDTTPPKEKLNVLDS